MTSSEKWPAIDIVKLVANYTYKEWNNYLYVCEQNENINSLVSTYYGLQKGYQYAVLQKVNTPFMVNTFIRLQKSLEKTLKRIWRKKYKNPLNDGSVLNNKDLKQHIQKKRNDDYAFELFLKKARF